MVIICCSCIWDARVLSLTEMRRGFSLACGYSGKWVWLVIGLVFLASSKDACPGSARSLSNSLTTGEETQNWPEVWGKWTLNSSYSLSTLGEITLHFIHSDFGSASLLMLILEQFSPLHYMLTLTISTEKTGPGSAAEEAAALLSC